MRVRQDKHESKGNIGMASLATENKSKTSNKDI